MLNNVQFIPAKGTGDFEQIARLADIIWREHYIQIIGAGQVNYMLEKFQSAHAIENQAADGVEYYTIRFLNLAVGYFAFENKGKELFLSKIYLLKEYRGKGVGMASMDFIAARAKEFGCARIALTVNKYNDRSISAYERMGFYKTESAIVDIGGGFVMDDYRMVKDLPND